MVEHDPIGLLLGRFGLTSLRTHLSEVEAAAQNGSWTYRQFLRELLEAEEAARRRHAPGGYPRMGEAWSGGDGLTGASRRRARRARCAQHRQR